MAFYPFVTLDVFTDVRFGGNPLAVFPDAAGLDGATMQTLAREFKMSEIAFVLPPDDPANSARVRIFTPTMEIGFAGHPNVGLGWVLGNAGRDHDGLLRLEQSAGLVEVEVERERGAVTRCRVGAPQPLALGQAPSRAELAACAGLEESDLGDTALASVGLTTACVEVSADTLARARCRPAAFEAVAADRPDLAQIFLLFLFAREGATVRARMFAPLSGTIEDPATGSAACAFTCWQLERHGGDRLTLDIVQGIEMGRPSRMRVDAQRIGGEVRAWVSGGCVPVLRGEAEV